MQKVRYRPRIGPLYNPSRQSILQGRPGYAILIYRLLIPILLSMTHFIAPLIDSSSHFRGQLLSFSGHFGLLFHFLEILLSATLHTAQEEICELPFSNVISVYKWSNIGGQ